MIREKKIFEKVGVVMGSQSDWDTMKNAVKILEKLSVPYEVNIVSAHRTPDRLYDYAKSAKRKGIRRCPGMRIPCFNSHVPNGAEREI